MVHDEQTRHRARLAFITAPSLDEAARSCGVSSSTLRAWKKNAAARGDDWDKARGASLMVGQGKEDKVQQIVIDVLHAFHLAIDETRNADLDPMERVERLSKLSMALHRTMQGLERAAPELSRLGIALDVITALTDFIAQKFPQHNEAFLEIMPLFSLELTRE